MNYAEDRLDRRARHPDGLQLLWKDYCEALGSLGSSSSSSSSDASSSTTSSSIHHTLLAKTLRDAGWNRHALFHFGMAWRLQPAVWEKAADYAQMAELSGYPELGLTAVLVYRTRRALVLPVVQRLEQHNGDKQQKPLRNASWLEESAPVGDCGCGCVACGRTVVPFDTSAALDHVLELLQEYLQNAENPMKSLPSLPTANEILKHEALPHPKRAAPWQEELSYSIPRALQFWNDNSQGNYRPFPIVLQLLTIKLLYETLPLLAAHAVVFMQTNLHSNARIQHEMATQYKSHWAYYVLVRAVLLGERTKVSRRHVMSYYHVPVWDLLYALDRRRDCCSNACQSSGDAIVVTDGKGTNQSIRNFLHQWRESILLLSVKCNTPRLLWRLPLQSNRSVKPLFWVGDSHVISTAWQQLCLGGRMRLVVPVVVTGLKAWHVRPETRFFTHDCLQTFLLRLQQQSNSDSNTWDASQTIVLSAGEIDCREGVGGESLQGYMGNCHEHIERTVAEYVRSLQQLLLTHENIQQILVLPVPPHCQSRKGRVKGRAFRRETTRYWNQVLRQQLACVSSVYVLDYESHLLMSDDSFVLKPALNADSTHMNAAFARHFEQAVMDCGCNLDLL